MLRQLTSFLGTLVLLGLVFGLAFWLFSRLMQPAPEAIGGKTAAPAMTEVVPADSPDKALPAQTPPQPAERQEAGTSMQATAPHDGTASQPLKPVPREAAPGATAGERPEAPSPAASGKLDDKALAELLHQSAPPQPAEAVRFSAEERREILKIRRQIADLLREKTGETP